MTKVGCNIKKERRISTSKYVKKLKISFIFIIQWKHGAIYELKDICKTLLYI